MKNCATLLLPLLLPVAHLMAQPEASCPLRLDSVYLTLQDPAVSDYRLTGKRYYRYDSQNRVVEYLEAQSDFATPFDVQNYLRELTDYPAAGQRNVLRQYWNSPTGQWQNHYRNELVYGPGNLLESSLGQTWDTLQSAWTNDVRAAFSFYPNGRYQTQLHFKWNAPATQWDTTLHIEYTPEGNITLLQQPGKTREISLYDADGNLLDFLSQKWNSAASVWENQTRREFTYDNQQRLTETINQVWSTPPGYWRNQSRTVNKFIQNLALPDTSMSYSWSLTGQDWMASQLHLYTVLADTHRWSRYVWNVPAGIWRFNTRRDSIFSPDGRLKTRFEFRGDQQTSLFWVNFTRFDYTYNAAGKSTGYTNRIWDDGPKQWILFEENWLEYYPDDSLLSNITVNLSPNLIVPPSGAILPPAGRFRQYFEPRAHHPVQYEYFDLPSSGGAGWTPSTFYEYFYSDCAVVSSAHTPSPADGCRFPNPFFPGSRILCDQLPPDAPLTLQVFDLNGREISAITAWPGQPVNAALPTGFHAVRVWQNDRAVYSGMVYFSGN